jgi:hypothetical protein
MGFVADYFTDRRITNWVLNYANASITLDACTNAEAYRVSLMRTVTTVSHGSGWFITGKVTHPGARTQLRKQHPPEEMALSRINRH